MLVFLYHFLIKNDIEMRHFQIAGNPLEFNILSHNSNIMMDVEKFTCIVKIVEIGQSASKVPTSLC